MNILENIKQIFAYSVITTDMILSVLLVTSVLCIYEFIVYRLVSHRAFYNKSFNICIGVLPFFISTIILCLQSNIVITLGTIGALAIIRFRTAVKDPVDMLYLLWAVHIGITCGCQLYLVAFWTSLVVTIVLLLMENISFGQNPVILVIHSKEEQEEQVNTILQSCSKRYRIKSKNYTSKGINWVVELRTKEQDRLVQELKASDIEQFSILSYDSDDIF